MPCIWGDDHIGITIPDLPHQLRIDPRLTCFSKSFLLQHSPELTHRHPAPTCFQPLLLLWLACNSPSFTGPVSFIETTPTKSLTSQVDSAKNGITRPEVKISGPKPDSKPFSFLTRSLWIGLVDLTASFVDRPTHRTEPLLLPEIHHRGPCCPRGEYSFL